MPILFSICIPTYNRPAELSETLKILSDQLSLLSPDNKDKIEIIISDNCTSVINISSIINIYANEFPHLSFVIQPENIGPTRNFEYCYTKAKGEYLIILSDDDHLMPGALNSIIECLLVESPDIVFLPFFITPGNELELACLDREKFLEKVNVYFTLVSSCILKRSLITDFFGQYLDTNMHHVHYFLRALDAGEKFMIFQKQILYSPYADNAGGYNWFKAFAGDFSRIVRAFSPRNISAAGLRRLRRLMFVDRVVPTFFNRMVNGEIVNKNFTPIPKKDICWLVAKNCYSIPEFWLLFLPIFFTPRKVLSTLKNIYIWQKPYFLKWH